MANVFFVVGRERSGTSYLQWLLKENFEEAIVLVLWKHREIGTHFLSQIDWNDTTQEFSPSIIKEIQNYAGRVALIPNQQPPIPLALMSNSSNIERPTKNKKSVAVENAVKEAIFNRRMFFVVNIKNPYGWHLSYSKRFPQHAFPSQMKYWSDFYTNWSAFEEKYPNNCLIVRHESLLRNFESEMQKVQDRFGVSRAAPEWKNTKHRIDSLGKEERKHKFTEKPYFMNEEYVQTLVEKEQKKLEESRKFLSVDIMNKFGYKLL